MHATQFIEKLQQLVADRGDLLLVNDDNQQVDVEFSEGDEDNGIDDTFVVG